MAFVYEKINKTDDKTNMAIAKRATLAMPGMASFKKNAAAPAKAAIIEAANM